MFCHRMRIFASLAMVLGLSGFSFLTPSWKSINNSIDKKFPEVRSMSTDELAGILENETILLIDVRQNEEFTVSSIRGARNIEDAKNVSAAPDTKIIVYCSAGYRSAEFASQLQQAGYSGVFNLRGSLFEWANKGYPLYQEDERTNYVHPFNKKWGKLLEKKYHSYTPTTQPFSK